MTIEKRMELAEAVFSEYREKSIEKIVGRINHSERELEDLYYTVNCLMDKEEYKEVDETEYELLYLAIHDINDLAYRFSVKL